ncbi:molybdenum cofactor biosynthesis protein B [Euzebya sp.]|uniref:MogA/MoaB family molybdenum cofactor biosynthesis protein n=1 Tax=Euzebya sp. TaxID=1971409 RepID=UPI0035169CF2
MRIITVSTRASAGVYDDDAGPAVAEVLSRAGHTVLGIAVVPDGREGVSAAIVEACADADVVITNGGTGLHPKDTTPEATADVIDREVPGIAQAIRAASLAITPMAMLSRATAGIRGSTLVVNVPGSPKGARESVEVLLDVLSHAVDQLSAGDHPR